MTKIKYFKPLMIVLAAITTSSVLAITPKSLASAEEFSKTAAHSESWKNFIASVGNAIPLYFKEEIIREAEKSTFPSVSFLNSKLLFKDENGNHISVELRNHGKIFLNDRAYEIRPLVNIATELARIEANYAHAKSTKNILDLLMPKAVAASSGRGVVLASYIVSSGWTDQQCGSGDLSSEQKTSCPQTAAAMQVSFKQPDLNQLFPVALTCPATEPNGTLDLISKNRAGAINRLRVVYSNYNPKSVEVDVALPGESLKKLLFVDLAAKNNPIDQEYVEELAVKSNALKTNVCEGSASNRQRYLAALAKNKSIFINAARDQDSDNGTDSGSSQQAL